MNKKNNQNRQPQKEVKRREDREEKSYDDQVEGRNSVLELLESGKDINKIFIAKGERHGSINKIIAIAKEKGISRMSAQAVGGAVGSNKIGIIIPCHRVVGANGNLTGYAGGIYNKEALLRLEGVDMSGMYIQQ